MPLTRPTSSRATQSARPYFDRIVSTSVARLRFRASCGMEVIFMSFARETDGGQGGARFRLAQKPHKRLHRGPLAPGARHHEIIMLAAARDQPQTGGRGHRRDREAPIGPAL